MAPLNDQIFALLANSGGNSNATNQLYATTAYGDKQRQMIAQEDPYSGLAQLGNIGTSAVFNAPGLSLRDRILGAALSGLVGGVGQGLSQNYQGRAQQAYNDAVLASLEGRTIEQPGELNASIFADAQNQANIFKLKQATAEQEANNKLKGDIVKEIFSSNLKNDENKSKALAEAVAQNPKKAGDIIRAFAALEGGAAPIAEEDKPKAEADKKVSLFGDGTSIQTKLENSMKRFIDEGSTPSAAADLASKAVQADAIRNKASADQIQKIRDQAKSLESIIGKAEAGMQLAGETGGILNGGRTFAAQVGNIFGIDSAQDKLAGMAQLDAARPEVVQALRAPGSGAISDYESRMMIGAGPSSSNTPEQNAAILGTMKATRDNAQSYAEFLDTYLAEKGDLLGADQKWGEYMKANPVNKPNRQTWLDYFSQQSGAGQAAQAPAGAATPQTTPTPSISREAILAELQSRGVVIPNGS